MGDLKCLALKNKSLELLKVFYFQNEYKYRFGPDSFNEALIWKDKYNIFFPKTSKVFKKILKYKNLKLKKHTKINFKKNQNMKIFKKIQDEQNVNDALQEATVLDRVSALKKKGIWSRDALPKVLEPNRSKAYWDYFINEIEWLSTDRVNRLNWKISAAKIIAESAKTYVFIKDEIKTLEFNQFQEEARLHCSKVAKMIKEWFKEKQNDYKFHSNIARKFSENSPVDLCQLWLSKSLIYCDNVDEDIEFQTKSDSDSLCSFSSSKSYSSVMFSEEENLCFKDMSFDFSDSNSPSENFIEEINWLESDMNISEIEMKSSFENEINELKILSQMPLEKIIDENYFSAENFDNRSVVYSDIDVESVLTDISQEPNDTLITTVNKNCFIKLQGEKIQDILNASYVEMLATPSDILEEILKNDSVNRNIKILYELIKIKCSFSIVSSLQVGDDRLILSVLFSFLSYKCNYTHPELIITTIPQIYEWQVLLSKLFPLNKIIILDSFISLNGANEVLSNLENSESLICIISYESLSIPFYLTPVKWNNVIYDRMDKLCENSIGIPDNVFLNDADILGSRIGLISQDTNFLSHINSANAFLRLLYSSFEVEELMNEMTHKNSEKILTVLLNHCIPLQKVYNFEHSCHLVMCELTPFQNSLHKHTINKLQKSLESNNLLNIIEAICQDIQLSQHPFCFESSDYEEAGIFNSLYKDYHNNLCSTYYLSNNDILSIYLPRKMYMVLSSLKEDKYKKVSNYILPHNILDPVSFGFTKYERLQMKNLLISPSNIDYSLNKVSTYLTDTDDEQSVNQNHFMEGDSDCIFEKREFLSSTDLDHLISELKFFNDNQSNNFMNKNFILDYELQEYDREKDLQMSSTLAARRSKTKFKSRLTSISKENEKYSVYLDCSDICYLMGSQFLLMDLDYFQGASNCLQSLKTIYKKYIENTSYSLRIVQPKVVSRSPRLISNCKLKSQNNSEKKLVESISKLFHEYLNTPKMDTKLFKVKRNELNLSGKLKTLNSMLLKISSDPLVKSCVIISHSFELLNLIEALIYINNNYGAYMKFRFNSYHEENEEYFFSLVEKFNRFQMRNKKCILLLHSRIDYQLLAHINVQSCSIIIADAHWQTDSDQLIFKLINRCGLNSIWSPENGVFSIYKLCCLETLEQYFLTNDLSFLHESSFNYRDDVISTSSAIVCKQSILKFFLDKLLSPLKEQLISGLSINEFQAITQKKSKLVKLSNGSLEDLFNSFENPYDLLQLCTYKSANSALTNKFKCLSDHSKKQLIRGKLCKQLNFGQTDITFKESLLNWEVNRANRQNKLKYLLNFNDVNNLLFYDPKCFLFKNELIWMPPHLDENIKVVQAEVYDKYILEPLKDTDLSLYLIPTINYITKSNYKKWDEKHLSCIAKEELSISQSSYIDTEKVKKRKLPTDFQMGELASFSLNHQKKRKIFTNRRYFTESESDHGNQSNLKARYKIEKKNDSELPILDTKDIPDIKKTSPTVFEASGVENQYPVNQHIQNNVGLASEIGKSNSIVLFATDSSTKISLLRPFYCKEGLKTLKIKRQLSSGALTNLPSKANVLTGSNMPNYSLPQRPTHQRGQLFINTKLGSSSESNTQSNGESEYEKLPEWNIHEEAVLYQNISHYQDHQLSTNISDKYNSLPNFKICEHYLNFYSITNTHRSNEMCKIHFTKLQMGFLNQNKGENSISRINRNSNITNSNGVLRVRAVNETRPIIGGVTGRKLKIKMKNSIGTYGTSIFGSTQAMTNKIKMFQSFLNDRKVNLTKTNQIVNSCLNSFDSKTTMTFKMLDDVVNTSKLPSLLPSHSQTIKKNATHISALAEHNIESDKIFTPAMLIQRREEIDKESELNNRQNLTPASYRNCFESNTMNSHSLNNRRNPSTNISNTQNLYSLQAPSSNQVITRTRYNVPLNRQVSGATVIHQQNSNQNSIMAPNVVSSQNQTSNLGTRSQAVQFQIQHSRNPLPRKTSNQQVIQRLYSGSMHNFPPLRQNHIMNRGSTAFVRPIIPTVVNQSNSQNTTTNSSIITVFPNSHDQSNNGIGRTIERNPNYNLSGHIKGSNIRTNIGTMSSNSRGNLNQMPRMLHVNQINRNNLNVNKTNNQEQ